jgi:hypothetical protein
MLISTGNDTSQQAAKSQLTRQHVVNGCAHPVGVQP